MQGGRKGKAKVLIFSVGIVPSARSCSPRKPTYLTSLRQCSILWEFKATQKYRLERSQNKCEAIEDLIWCLDLPPRATHYNKL